MAQKSSESYPSVMGGGGVLFWSVDGVHGHILSRMKVSLVKSGFLLDSKLSHYDDILRESLTRSVIMDICGSAPTKGYLGSLG